MERVMGRLARKIKLEPAGVRRHNLIQPEQIPYTTGFPAGRSGLVYDSGNYPRLLEMALEKLGKDPGRSGQADGRLVGMGVACCVESTGFGRGEPAKIRGTKDGIVHVYVGSSPQGQGHETMGALVAAERLGLPDEKMPGTAGDTRAVPL